jgi:hypothetical protein
LSSLRWQARPNECCSAAVFKTVTPQGIGAVAGAPSPARRTPDGERQRMGWKVTNQVIVDADELEHFARSLQHFNTQLFEGTKRLAADSHRLAETWRDPAHAQFARELDQTVAVLHQFLRVSEAYIPALLTRARRAREVHG